jgi:hypothetical protein
MESKVYQLVISFLFGASLFLLASVVSAQDIHVCMKDGKKIMTDQPCERIGAVTKQIRTPDSFRPLTVIGGVTPGERQLMQQYKARDAAENALWEADRARDREAARQQAAANQRRCDQLNAEKNNIVVQLRQNSTQWLNDRHRAVNDEMYRLNCQTL